MCKEEPVATFTEGTIEVSLFPDTCECNPREDDNLGVMVCWHRRYLLGDQQPKCPPGEWHKQLAMGLDPGLGERLGYWEEEGCRCLRRKFGAGEAAARSEAIRAQLIEKVLRREVPVMLPLYLYDHSGITMSTTGFSCPWDSGQVGWIYATRETIEIEYGKVDAGTLSLVRQVLEAEVEAYDQYLTGDIYRYEARCVGCGAYLDACGGFLGRDNAREEAQRVAAYEAAHHICPAPEASR